EIEYRFFADPPTRFSALESGDAQVMGEIPPLTARSMTGNSQIQLIPSAIAGQPQQFIINTQKFPTDNITFRQALLTGTNRSAITDVVFQGFSPVAWGPITSNTQFYSGEMNGMYSYNAEQAIALLASLGYTDADQNGYLDNPSVEKGDIEVKLIVPPWGSIPQIAQLIQDQWKVLGIKAILVSVPDFSTLLDLVKQGDYNLVAFYTFGVDPAFLNSFFASDGSRNWTGFSNSELDNVLFGAQRQLESGTRSTLYARAQKIIMDNALILPIRESVNLNAAVDNIDGLTFDPYGWFPLMANVRLKSAETAGN
ncbi:MAG TPA: ABC transporter substrate-binding protein, partial [Phototrophicaceae bacterium]|nr:ABC transporter substrate-binding protein [Phototrophicaceae bacterium]